MNHSRPFYLITSWLALLTITLFAEASKSPAGYIGHVEGKVIIERAGGEGQQEAATIGSQVYAGDAVNTGENAKAILILSGQEKKTTVAANRSYKVKSSEKKEESWLGSLFSAIFSLTDSEPSQNYATVLMVRGEETGGPALSISPNTTALLEDRPRFEWNGIADANNYVVKLMDLDENTIWHTETAKPTLAYPENQAALQHGAEYFLQVSAYKGKRILTSGIANFKLLSAKKAAHIRNLQTEYQSHPFILASGYAAHELYDLAAENIHGLLKQDPTNEMLSKMLANIYLKQGKVEQAKSFWAKQ